MPSFHNCFTYWFKMEIINYSKPLYAPEGISQKVLTESLRQIINDGLVIRKDFKSNPPHVEYSLSELGLKLQPIINAMVEFGDYYKSLYE